MGKILKRSKMAESADDGNDQAVTHLHDFGLDDGRPAGGNRGLPDDGLLDATPGTPPSSSDDGSFADRSGEERWNPLMFRLDRGDRVADWSFAVALLVGCFASRNGCVLDRAMNLLLTGYALLRSYRFCKDKLAVPLPTLPSPLSTPRPRHHPYRRNTPLHPAPKPQPQQVAVISVPEPN